MPKAPDIDPILRLTHLYRNFPHPGGVVAALQDVSLVVHRGESCAITGTSGSGKSTLLNILGLLDKPDAGKFEFCGMDVTSTSADQLAQIRNDKIGFVFQSFNLLPQLDAVDNVALPLYYRGIDREPARKLACEQLDRMGLSSRALHKPADMSGGQRQRVAIARALIGQPSIILADEPTGSLDSSIAAVILDTLFDLNREKAVSLLIVTHDVSAAARCERHFDICHGRLLERGLPDARRA
ncbi:ABC transporter ATP-binding protein [Janthinobacterium sp. GW458P]|uniref:ABC transporter ATP-binding protein n=1 Tax=Janthinobacterium sp. GW458P TaxID=1981504 RepID=UPI000A325EA9|nr:ABC transporter ATP-binding protein [Janthinobacterium sp. GW458P]MBE3028013.1 ABC transporter ATP-binding protein [Janthinobacterium sp. GW458P]